MAAEFVDHGYVSDELVERMAFEQRDRLSGHDPSPTLGVVLGTPVAANVSYGLRLLTHGEMLVDDGETPPIELYLPTRGGFELIRTSQELRDARKDGLFHPKPGEGSDHDANIAGLIEDLNDRPDITGILPLLPSATGEGDANIRATISPYKDPDGISPDRLVTPATPESQVVLASHIVGKPLGEIDPRSIGIVGNGPLVGGPLYKEVLPAHGVDTRNLGAVLGSKEEIIAGVPRLHERDLRLIFTAVPVGALIRAEHVSDGTIIIDAGYGVNRETGQPSGNAHPELVALNGLRGTITSFRRGVGPVTAAIIFDRTIPPHSGDQQKPMQFAGASA